ncbi:uncharacterized protein LOC113280911 isoform X1 [Papaver somniferum]|uniref:uncharacterized protein LOC113280911 isoform X1 n=1 Tax=Papaver somniferum TaxID=3469 RepID=UPI000E6FF806|nr:uncharacterized protein LOC113280911 isoform X1 [Papaver somniferum]XP_026385302.1 uncharacterized protein LOC113280911 isoform X1 [Papaver somniferum]
MVLVISAHRDIMMGVVDRWETSPPEEKDQVLQLFVDDVQLNLNNLAYESKDDLLADLEIIKKLNSIFEPQRMKHQEDICNVLLDQTRAMQGILKPDGFSPWVHFSEDVLIKLIQLLMADMLSSGKGKEIKKWMKQKMEDAGSKEDISKYLYRSEEKEQSLIYSLQEMGAEVENLKKAKLVDKSRGFIIGKCHSTKTETKKDRLALKKKYSHLQEQLKCASSEYTKLCGIELPFEEHSRNVRQCLRRLKERVECQLY